MGQEPILLGFIKAVDFIHKQQRACPCQAAFIGTGEDFAQFCNAIKHRGYRLKRQSCLCRQQSGDGGFTRAWRAPKDQ